MRLAAPCLALAVAACGGTAATDGGIDATLDAARDAGPFDSGRHDSGARDLGVDAGTVIDPGGTCGVGAPCDATNPCVPGLVCQPAIPPFGPPTECGGSLLSPTLYVGGFCTNMSSSGAGTSCDPLRASDDPTHAGEDGCPPCAKCVPLPFAPAPPAPLPAECEPRCTPSATTNGGCRGPLMGYVCDVFSRTCQNGGCQSDLECADREDPTGACVAPGAHCNLMTGRCEHSGATGAAAGDVCLHDSECETDGVCLTEAAMSFPGGYCTQYGCNVSGMECANALDICEDLGASESACLHRCTVDAESPSLILGAGGHGDTCRPGYQCLYNPESTVGAPGNGGCWLGNYDDVTTNDVGHTCSADTDCFSPHGAGRCIFSDANQACSILGCAGYPVTDDLCGVGNGCFTFGDSSSACLHVCTTPGDCATIGAPATDGCVQLTSSDPRKYCWPGCMADTDCLAPMHCLGASPTSAGTCG